MGTLDSPSSGALAQTEVALTAPAAPPTAAVLRNCLRLDPHHNRPVPGHSWFTFLGRRAEIVDLIQRPRRAGGCAMVSIVPKRG